VNSKQRKTSAIRVKNLKKHFGKIRAVDGISFAVEKGEIFGYLGPNGAGKTTTIRCLMDFIRPDGGSVKILGRDAQENSAELKCDVGFLPGEVNLYENWTGQEHIDLLEKVRGSSKFDDTLISTLDFDPSRKIKNLSTGNKKKLALILALMHKSKLLILDEPTAGLDPLLRNTIHEILRDEVKKGKTVFISSHDLSEVEKICDRICIIKEGKIVDTESVAGIKKKRLYTIHVYFKGKVPKEKFSRDGVEVTKEFSDGLVLTVRGDVTPVLSKLARYSLKDLEITHASLEEVFMEFYR
jgi:ABC-2 type transport system ATP-binding protein